MTNGENITLEQMEFAKEILKNGEPLYEFHCGAPHVSILKYENVMYAIQYMPSFVCDDYTVIYDMYTIG